MRIAIDARELSGQPTGVGRVLSGLLEAWPEDDELFLYAREPIPWRVLRPPRKARVLPGSSRLPGAVWEQSLLPAAVRRDGAEALFSPAYGLPALLDIGSVVGMHDCAVEATPAEFSWRERTRRRWAARIAARKASYLLVGSHFAADEVRRWYGTSSARIVVAPYGVSPGFGPVEEERREAVRRQYQLSPRTVLFVGAPLARRNLEGLIDVVAELGRTREDLSLVMAGPRRRASAELQRFADSSGLGDRLRWLGFVPDVDLPALYASATVVAYPSRYEGFGLPVLEALACGAAVVASDTGSLAEIFPQRAWLVPHADREAWVEAIATLLDDPEELQRWKGRSQAWANGKGWAPAARLLRNLLVTAASERDA
jgi:glycosyltransferase involved in cell wall biosynthesis